MGNNLKGNQVQLKIKNERIIIHHAYKMILTIGSLETFPHGFDGLRLWEAGIILARYVVHNPHLFKNKRVLELGAGVGIAGLTVKKWTECKEIEMTDYHPSVIDNINHNMEKNSAVCPVFNLDWKKHGVHTTQYDIIMGSDIVYFGCPVQDLYQVFKQNLSEGGIGIIVIPIRKNYAELFSKLIEKDKFSVEIEKIDKQQYFQSPLEDKQEGLKTYPLLKQLSFEVYKLTRIAL